MELEQKFSKQQIFEFYANSGDLGQRGSFTISGFGEASQAYFNKDLKDITLPEAALLAGHDPARRVILSPYRHPERALERRNLVLDSMADTHAITREQADKAKATPLKLAPPNVEASDAPYFVDLVRDTVISRFNEREMNEHSYRIYTTLDPDLQKAAAQAVETGMKLVDEQVIKRRTKRMKVGRANSKPQLNPGRKRRWHSWPWTRTAERCWLWSAAATTASASWIMPWRDVPPDPSSSRLSTPPPSTPRVDGAIRFSLPLPW